MESFLQAYFNNLSGESSKFCFWFSLWTLYNGNSITVSQSVMNSLLNKWGNWEGNYFLEKWSWEGNNSPKLLNWLSPEFQNSRFLTLYLVISSVFFQLAFSFQQSQLKMLLHKRSLLYMESCFQNSVLCLLLSHS